MRIPLTSNLNPYYGNAQSDSFKSVHFACEMEKNKRLEDFIQSKFAKLDVNKDGKLSYEEVRKGVKDLKLPYGEREIDQLLKDLDVNKDGEISFEVN